MARPDGSATGSSCMAIQSSHPVQLAMWSGPRNISTAMMRSWGNRPDCTVVDEPLYAHYLHATGRIHPGRDETLAAGPTEVSEAIDRLLGAGTGRKGSVLSEAHDAPPAAGDRSRWMRALTNCFLIRKPAEVLTSLVKHVPDLTLADTGFPQQAEIFDLVCQWTNRIPPVIDAADVLRDPRWMLTLLCEAVGVEFTDRMLQWEPGLRDTDGVWAKYWYKEVETTTGFRPYRTKDELVPHRWAGYSPRVRPATIACTLIGSAGNQGTPMNVPICGSASCCNSSTSGIEICWSTSMAS